MKGAREGLWNSERFLCFPACILQMLRGVRRTAGEIKIMLEERMNTWEKRWNRTLVKSVEDQWNQDNVVLHAPKTDVESVGRRFDGLIKDGKLRATIRSVTER